MDRIKAGWSSNQGLKEDSNVDVVIVQYTWQESARK